MDNKEKIREIVREWFYNKITYPLSWMLDAEMDVQDILLPQIKELGYTFDLNRIEYDEELLNKVVDQITESIMENLKPVK